MRYMKLREFPQEEFDAKTHVWDALGVSWEEWAGLARIFGLKPEPEPEPGNTAGTLVSEG
jgi:hypothetical protein